MNESTIVANITKALKSRGCFVVKIHGGSNQRAGLPDLLVIFDGRILGLEVKLPGGQATRLQEHTLEQMRKAGAAAAVVCSVAEAVSEFEVFQRLGKDACGRNEVVLDIVGK